METILGIKGKNFAVVAADKTQARSIVVMKDDENKIYELANNLVVATMGEPGDAVQFVEFIAKNLALYKKRNGYDLSPHAGAHYTRKNLADYLRSRRAYHVNMMMAGCDTINDPEGEAKLYYIDYLANKQELKFSGQGYGGMFCQSIFDRYYNDNLTVDEAYEILKKCVAEIQKRLVVNLKNFQVAVVDKNGVRYLDDIKAPCATAPGTRA